MLTGWRRAIARIALLVLQWLLITTGLGAVVVYSAPPLEGLIDPHFDLTYIIIAAALLAGLLGVIVRSLVLAIPLAILMCAGSTIFFAFAMFAPTWDGTVVRSTELENFVTTRMLLFSLIMSLPALIGVLIGNLAGGMLDERREILTDYQAANASWWSNQSNDSES